MINAIKFSIGEIEASDQYFDHTSSTALPILKKSLFERIQIPVPPLPLQKEFGARMSEIRAAQAEQAASRTRLDNLFQSMLHSAFNGQL